MAQRGLKWTTIGVYLRRVRAVHKAQNMSPLWSSDDVRQALKGVRNSPSNLRRPTRNRVPVTPFLLLKIKKELSRDKGMSLIDKRLSHVSCQSYTIEQAVQVVLDVLYLGLRRRLSQCRSIVRRDPGIQARFYALL